MCLWLYNHEIIEDHIHAGLGEAARQQSNVTVGQARILHLGDLLSINIEASACLPAQSARR